MTPAMAVVNTFGGALPTKGLTLPLLSYGGSSLITVLVLLALILRVDYENRLAQMRAARRAS
jgi:cell division protein FtsW